MTSKHDSRERILLDILEQMFHAVDDENIKHILQSQMDTVAHAAPEIVDQQWKPLYNLCRMRLNDASNPQHAACYKIYHDGYHLYKSLFVE